MPFSYSRRLTLRTLLLGSYDLEVTAVERVLLLLLLCLGIRVALLRDLAPSSARLVLGRACRVALVEDALGGQLAAAQELLGEMAAVNVVSRGMDRLCDELQLSREREEGGNKLLSCYRLDRVNM